MRAFSRALSTLLLLSSFPALAQTYTPKTIRVEAPPVVDIAEALRIAALPTNVPLTKQQIETALQRLADTGLFSDVGYTVDSAALVIKLTPSASSQLQPAHFSNFIWWQPTELESLLEARVPGYHGMLPLGGTLTDQVQAALFALLKTKGVDATIDVRQTGSSAESVTLSIVNPAIIIGDLHLQNPVPALEPGLTKIALRLHGQDFDIAETTRAVQDSVNDVFVNAGYLAVNTSAPTYSAPHKDLLAYAVDLTATITPGDVYHLTSITLHAQPPLTEADLAQAANLKPGDVASLGAQRLARGEMQRAYADQGYFDAQVLFTLHADNQAHTVEYVVNFVPGELFHFGSIDASALAPDQQAAFLHAFTAAPGTVADAKLSSAIQRAIQSLNLGYPVSLGATVDRQTHLVKFILKTTASSSAARPQ